MFITCNSSQDGGCCLGPFISVLLSLSSQYGAYPGGPSVMKQRKYFMSCIKERREEHISQCCEFSYLLIDQ